MGVGRECRLGRGDRAMKFYHALCPYYQNDIIEIRRRSRIPTVSLLWERTIRLTAGHATRL